MLLVDDCSVDAALGRRHSSLPNTFVVVIVDGAELRGIYSTSSRPAWQEQDDTFDGAIDTWDFDAATTILVLIQQRGDAIANGLSRLCFMIFILVFV